MKRHYYHAIALVSIGVTLLLAEDVVRDTVKVDTAKKSAQVPATGGEDLINPDSGNPVKSEPTQGSANAVPATKIRTKEELQAKYSVEEVRLREDSSLYAIYGDIQIVNATGDLEQDAVTFLNEIAPLFGYEDVLSEYRVFSKRSFDVVFQQYHNGVPVSGARIYVESFESNTITSVRGKFLPDLFLSTTPSISINTAEDVAVGDMGLERVACSIQDGTLEIKKLDEQYRLVWTLSVFDTVLSPGYSYTIDAHTGEILKKARMEAYLKDDGLPASSDRGNNWYLDTCPLVMGSPYMSHEAISACDHEVFVEITLTNSSNVAVSGNYSFYIDNVTDIEFDQGYYSVAAGGGSPFVPGTRTISGWLDYSDFAGLNTGPYNLRVSLSNDDACDALIGQLTYTRDPLEVSISGFPVISPAEIPYDGSMSVTMWLDNNGEEGDQIIKLKVFNANGAARVVAPATRTVSFECNSSENYSSGPFSPSDYFGNVYSPGNPRTIRAYKEVGGTDIDLNWTGEYTLHDECVTGSGNGDNGVFHSSIDMTRVIGGYKLIDYTRSVSAWCGFSDGRLSLSGIETRNAQGGAGTGVVFQKTTQTDWGTTAEERSGVDAHNTTTLFYDFLNAHAYDSEKLFPARIESGEWDFTVGRNGPSGLGWNLLNIANRNGISSGSPSSYSFSGGTEIVSLEVVPGGSSPAVSSQADVIGHEWGHGMWYNRYYQPSSFTGEASYDLYAIREAFCDIVGVVFSRLMMEDDDWQIGEGFGSNGESCIRDLENPHSTGHYQWLLDGSPAYRTEPLYYISGDLCDQQFEGDCDFCGHHNSTVIGKMFNLLALGTTVDRPAPRTWWGEPIQVSGIGEADALRIIYYAVDLLVPADDEDYTYSDFRNHCIAAARALQDEGVRWDKSVQDAFAAVYVGIPASRADCSSNGPLDEHYTPNSGQWYAVDLTDDFARRRVHEYCGGTEGAYPGLDIWYRMDIENEEGFPSVSSVAMKVRNQSEFFTATGVLLGPCEDEDVYENCLSFDPFGGVTYNPTTIWTDFLIWKRIGTGDDQAWAVIDNTSEILQAGTCEIQVFYEVPTSIPSLSSPVDGANFCSADELDDATFSWTSNASTAEEVIGYYVQFDTDADFSGAYVEHPIMDADLTPTPSTSLSGRIDDDILPNQTGELWYWRVVSRNWAGNSRPSAARSFYLDRTPGPAGANLLPEYESYHCSNDQVTYSWTASTDPHVTGYRLELRRDGYEWGDGSSDNYKEIDVSGTSHTLQLSPNNSMAIDWYWRVLSISDCGVPSNPDEAEVGLIHVDTAPPIEPALPEPDACYCSTDNVRFAWPLYAGDGIVDYVVRLWDERNLDVILQELRWSESGENTYTENDQTFGYMDYRHSDHLGESVVVVWSLFTVEHCAQNLGPGSAPRAILYDFPLPMPDQDYTHLIHPNPAYALCPGSPGHTFVWEPMARADDYILHWSTDGFHWNTDASFRWSNRGSTVFTLTGYEVDLPCIHNFVGSQGNGQVYWQVVAIRYCEDVGEIMGSLGEPDDWMRLTYGTGNRPTFCCGGDYYPPANSPICESIPTRFGWGFPQAYIGDVSNFVFDLSHNADFSGQVLRRYTTTNDTFITHTFDYDEQNPNNNHYYWRVCPSFRCGGDYGAFAAGPELSVEVEPRPQAQYLISPPDGQSFCSDGLLDIVFDWTGPLQWVDSYIFEYANNESFSDPTPEHPEWMRVLEPVSEPAPDPFAVRFGPDWVGTMYWRVYAVCSCDQVVSSGAPRTVVINSAPIDGPTATVQSRTPTEISLQASLPLGASGWRVHYGTSESELTRQADFHMSQAIRFGIQQLERHDVVWYFRVAATASNQDGSVCEGPLSPIVCAPFSPTTAGQMTSSERWFCQFDPVVNVSSTLNIHSGGSLTIEPGTTVNLAQGAHIRSYGNLTAIGSGTDSIRFIGSNPQTAGSLLETFPTSAVTLDRVVVTNGWFGYLCRGSSVNITSSRFSQNRHGLVMVDAAPYIEESAFTSNAPGYGAVVVRSDPTFEECSIRNNERAGLLVWNSNETELYGNSISLNGGNSPNVWNSGIRMLNGYVDMRCNELSQNNGPGLSILQGYADMVTDPGVTPGGRNKLTSNSTNTSLGDFGQLFLQGTAAIDIDYGWNTFSGTQLITSLMTYDPIPPSDPNVPVQLYTFMARGNYWGTTDINSIQQRLPSISVVEPILTQQISCPNLGPVDPNDSPARVLFDQGLVLEHSANPEEAYNRYKSIVKDYPKSKEAPMALKRMSTCYKLMNYTWPETRAHFISMADTIDPVIKMAALNTAAWCLVEMGDMNAARSEFQSLIDISLKDYDILYNSMGKLMTELEDEDWGSLGTAGTKSKAQVTKAGTNSVKQPESPSEQKLAISLSRALESLDSLLGVSSGQPRGAVPTSYMLYQNYPNPFNPNTEIRFDIPEAVRVELKVFNILGQEVTTLVDDVRAAGDYRILWDGKNTGGLSVASGVYVYQLKAGNFQDAKKMVLLR